MPYCPPPTPPIGCGPKAWEGYRAECARRARADTQCIWAYIICCLAMFVFFGWMLYSYNPSHREAAVSEQRILRGLEHLRCAAEEFDIDPNVFFRAAAEARPNSALSEAAEDEVRLRAVRESCGAGGWHDTTSEG